MRVSLGRRVASLIAVGLLALPMFGASFLRLVNLITGNITKDEFLQFYGDQLTKTGGMVLALFVLMLVLAAIAQPGGIAWNVIGLPVTAYVMLLVWYGDVANSPLENEVMYTVWFGGIVFFLNGVIAFRWWPTMTRLVGGKRLRQRQQ